MVVKCEAKKKMIFKDFNKKLSLAVYKNLQSTGRFLLANLKNYNILDSLLMFDKESNRQQQHTKICFKLNGFLWFWPDVAKLTKEI